ncbi:HSF-type DNA-binding-domain-containing protein [Aspergillus ambiguus]|uniref:heat shock factor family protein n=1 Tax=Aspergillus ambiguus TaxID=176160 RepID=UPI003CCDE1DD
MSGLADPPPSRTPAVSDAPGKTRQLPVLSSSVPPSSSHPPVSDPMDVTPASSAEADRPAATKTAASNGAVDSSNVNNHTAPAQAIGAAAAAQQPKVVQTAFIHKLYNMLEDSSIQHLISWSSTNDSFVMSPTSEFSKVLAQYFKHTNISSFVRQLNMYGFHKVSDVFHTGSPDSALWEFKHGNGNFKRGDLVGLREIKRRASRHALIHRDSFPSHKAAASQPGTPAEPVPDATDARLMNLEHTLYDMHTRLTRAEEGNVALNARCQAMAESLTRCYHWSHSISRFLQGMIPDRESLLYRDVTNMQTELEKHLDAVRALEQPADPYLSVRPPYIPTVSVDPGPPLSPRQMPQEDRRGSMMESTRSGMIRPPVPPHLAVSPRRYGSIGAANASPNYNRTQAPPVPPQPPVPHPLSAASSPPGGPNLARRHTSADIRQHGWPPPGVSPFPSAHQSGTATAPWSPSPHRTPTSSEQQVREVLAQYEMGAPRRFQDTSRHGTPPLHPDQPAPPPNTDNGWGLGPRFPRHESSLPATRRSSMASNVHSLLNPADTAERPDEDQYDDRKRKRLE